MPTTAGAAAVRHFRDAAAGVRPAALDLGPMADKLKATRDDQRDADAKFAAGYEWPASVGNGDAAEPQTYINRLRSSIADYGDVEVVIREPYPPWGDLSDGERLAAMGTDAEKWADAFRVLNESVPEKGPLMVIAQDVLIGWFANAIEAGREAGRTPLPKRYDVVNDQLIDVTQEWVDDAQARLNAHAMLCGAIDASMSATKRVADGLDRPWSIKRTIEQSTYAAQPSAKPD